MGYNPNTQCSLYEDDIGFCINITILVVVVFAVMCMIIFVCVSKESYPIFNIAIFLSKKFGFIRRFWIGPDRPYYYDPRYYHLNNIDYVRLLLIDYPDAYKQLSDEFKQDRSLIRLAYNADNSLISSIPFVAFQDEFVEELIGSNNPIDIVKFKLRTKITSIDIGDIIRDVPDIDNVDINSLNKETILDLIECNPNVYLELSNDFKKDIDIIKKTLTKHPSKFVDIPEYYLDNQEIAELAAKSRGIYLGHYTRYIKDHDVFAIECVKRNHKQFEYCSDRVKGDIDVIIGILNDEAYNEKADWCLLDHVYSNPQPFVDDQYDIRLAVIGMSKQGCINRLTNLKEQKMRTVKRAYH